MSSNLNQFLTHELIEGVSIGGEAAMIHQALASCRAIRPGMSRSNQIAGAKPWLL